MRSGFHAGRWALLAGLMLGCGGLQARAQGQNADRLKTDGVLDRAQAVLPAGQTSDTGDAGRTKLISDTHKLLTLSREVQAEMVKNGPDTLSLGMVKKVEEMQKLAAKLKAAMAGSP